MAFTLVLILAFGSVILFVDLAAHREAESFDTSTDEVRSARVARTVPGFYSKDGVSPGVQTPLEQSGRLSGRRFLETDTQGVVVGASNWANPNPHSQKPGREFRPDPDRQQAGGSIASGQPQKYGHD
jgi:hypothetical protein